MQEKMKTPCVTRSNEFPRKGRNFTYAAEFSSSLDDLAAKLGTKQYRYTIREEHDSSFWQKVVFLKLGDDRYATLSEHQTRERVIEIGLQLHNFRIFDERDLLEVASLLPLAIADIDRVQNGLVWVPFENPIAGQ